MYIFTTLGYSHKNVWEQDYEFSRALFSSRYEHNYLLNKMRDTLTQKNKCFAVGYYAPYYGRNSNQQGEPAQFDHSSLLLIQKIEFNNSGKYDIVIFFKLLKKFSPDITKKIINLKPNPTPLISFIDDIKFLKLLDLDPDYLNEW